VSRETEGTIAALIDGALEIGDPLDGLAEKAVTDRGAPFQPDVVERLAALKNEDRSAFEALRAQLKKSGCRVTALDDAIREECGDTRGRGPTQADILIDLAQTANLFHTPDGIGFADLDINGHRETWPIRSKGFRRWLTRRFFEKTGGAPSSEALQSALNVIEAKAHFDAPERTVHVRVAGLDGKVYIDLCTEIWSAVEIDAAGWRIVDNPPVRFRRASGMRALPAPARGGSIAPLRSFLNVRSDADFVLVVAWILAAFREKGPYPALIVSGEQGSAKSTFSSILRSLLDPNTAPLRALPREERDLFIAATNGHVLVFDNVSGLPAWISDSLCRLATGGGFAVRQLYSDQDEVLFDAARPVMLNWHRGHRDPAGSRRSRNLSDVGPDSRRAPSARGRALERIRGRTSTDLRRPARRDRHGSEATACYPSSETAAHGRFRALGDGLRGGPLDPRRVLVGLLRQPRRSGRGRDRRRSGRRRRAGDDAAADGADGVDGHRLGPSGRPWGDGRRPDREVQDLAR
jgi:hypothetical protein